MFGSKKEIFAFLATQRDNYPLKLMCRVYDVSREGYYSWKRRGPSKYSQLDEQLREDIEAIYEDVDGIYGSPKIHQALQQQGISVGEKPTKSRHTQLVI